MYLLDLLGLCENTSFLRFILIIKNIIKILFIIIPIILIIFIIKDLFQSLTNPEKNPLKDSALKILKRTLSALIIFLIPNLVSYAISLVTDSNPFKNCMDNSTKEKVMELSKIEEAQKKKEENKDLGTINIKNNNQTKEAKEIIDKAVTWAINIANNDTYGYSNENGHQLGQDNQYSCVGLVIMAFKNNGLDLYANGTYGIQQMPQKLKEYNFVEVTNKINLRTGEGLEKGDILWRINDDGHGHTELYIGNNQLVGAKSDNGGGTKDVDGNEISITNYYNMPWQKVFRYMGN